MLRGQTQSRGRTTGGGETVLHTLATAKWRSVADCRNTNTICFTLAEKRPSLTATDALGQTPAEASQAGKVKDKYGNMVEHELNHHLVTSPREIAAYKQRRYK